MAYTFRPSPHLHPGELLPAPDRLAWPGGRRLAVCLGFELWSTDSFDALQIIGSTVDFGVRRGVGNVLAVLGRHAVPATFFVNGLTAARHPALLGDLVAAGHEVAPLGYTLAPHWDLPPGPERDQVRRGIEAVASGTGTPVTGWRTPFSRPSRSTHAILREQGIRWDSSLRNDERVSKFPVPAGALLEIPFGGAPDYHYYSPFPGPVKLVPGVTSVYLDELAVLSRESATSSRLAVFNFNPSYTGRPADLGMLDAVLTAVGELPAPAWCARFGELADWLAGHDEWFVRPEEALESA
jgi:peptidoglycan/xylan/chitin deacetylase (PgdA/CDA1 family)